MNDTIARTESALQQAWKRVETLRDEIKLRIHLGGMDAKTEWEALAPKLLEAEKAVVDGAKDGGHELVDGIIVKLKSINALIDGG